MKFTPILLSAPMVKATLAGTKSMTRRTKGLEGINENPDNWQFEWADFILDKPWRFTDKSSVNKKSLKKRDFIQEAVKCPYGKVGDVLWVKEAYYAFGNWAKQKDKTAMGRKKLRFIDRTMDSSERQYHYLDSNLKELEIEENRFEQIVCWWKRSSLFMPKKACRTFLEITKIRVQRLNEISEEDSKAEGILGYYDDIFKKETYKDYMSDASGYGDPDHDFPLARDSKDSFKTLWQKINGKDSWDKNPWVWVIEFKKISKPVNFI